MLIHNHNIMKKVYRIFTLLISAFICTLTSAEIRMPAVFGDNMVLQQQSEVAVWGWASSGKKVSVVCSWDNKTYTTQSNAKGEWKLMVKTPAASFKPYNIIVSDGKAINLKDILIGEVWLCSGQSNMDMPLKGYKNQPITNSAEDILNAANNNIRLFQMKKNAAILPQEDCEGEWLIAAPESVADFSATAYYFGIRLYSFLNIPIGLIHTSQGGSKVECWMTPETLKKYPDIILPDETTEIQRSQTPTVLYNAMLHPITGYGIRGAIWYQGESNVSNYKEYGQKFTDMINEWRNLWNIGNFPFYFTQIAPYNYGNINSAYLREAQQKCQQIPNTGMAVLMDADSPYCIHPPKKKDAGDRLALWALAKTYNRNVVYKSPEVSKVEIQGQVVVLSFDVENNTGLTSYNKEIKGFLVAGKNKRFYPAIASIDGNKVFVLSPQVLEPAAVRYTFDNISQTEIFSINGALPVSSFRTDDW